MDDQGSTDNRDSNEDADEKVEIHVDGRPVSEAAAAADAGDLTTAVNYVRQELQ